MSDFYDRAGKPIELMQWALLIEGSDYHRIAFDRFPNGAFVSTVWLGIDHSFGHGPPLIFESMVFGGVHNEMQLRWSTEAQAIQGHDQLCARVREGEALLMELAIEMADMGAKLVALGAGSSSDE